MGSGGGSQRWWYKEGIYLKAENERAAEAIATDLESESDLESEAEAETHSEVGGEERSASSGVSRPNGEEWSGAE